MPYVQLLDRFHWCNRQFFRAERLKVEEAGRVSQLWPGKTFYAMLTLRCLRYYKLHVFLSFVSQLLDKALSKPKWNYVGANTTPLRVLEAELRSPPRTFTRVHLHKNAVLRSEIELGPQAVVSNFLSEASPDSVFGSRAENALRLSLASQSDPIAGFPPAALDKGLYNCTER